MARTKRQRGERCAWTQDDDGNYQTDCGELFVFIEGGPTENRVRYCCYCGAAIKVVRDKADR